jgi:hypothetical protein
MLSLDGSALVVSYIARLHDYSLSTAYTVDLIISQVIVAFQYRCLQSVYSTLSPLLMYTPYTIPAAVSH